MTKDDVILKTLDALFQAWLETMTPVEIRQDPDKVRLMVEAHKTAVGQPTELVRYVYEEVFLRDVWRCNTEPG